MLDGQMRTTRWRAITVATLLAAVSAIQLAHAQGPRDRDRDQDRWRNGRYDAYTRPAVLDPGTFITVRTRQTIQTDRADGRLFPATVERDVWDEGGRLAVPVIPRGTPVELSVRSARDGDLILDLESVTIGRQRYAIDADASRIDAGRPRDNHAGEFIGGGAIIGTIIGAIAGGGKGAAIGAATGAAAGGVGVLTQGRSVRVPPGSVLTFRLDQPLAIGGRGARR